MEAATAATEAGHSDERWRTAQNERKWRGTQRAGGEGEGKESGYYNKVEECGKQLQVEVYPIGHLPFPGVVARRGVPGGLRGVGGGIPVSRRSAMPTDASAARWTSRTARRAASPTCVCGRSASILDSARRRSCGSVVGGRGCVGGMYDERAVGSGCDEVGCERDDREMLSRAKRRSRSASDTRVVCSAELAKECNRSICSNWMSL